MVTYERWGSSLLTSNYGVMLDAAGTVIAAAELNNDRTSKAFYTDPAAFFAQGNADDYAIDELKNITPATRAVYGTERW